VRAGLGTLNHAALTTEALAARGLACAGLVIGAWPAEPDLAARRNVEDLETYAGVRLLGRMPAGAGDLDRAAFLAAARENLTTEVYA
jgi:dethiobiotin synthetase